MTYTHTINLVINGIDIEGELGFEVEPCFKTASDLDLSVSELGMLNNFIRGIISFRSGCGEIQKIEINIKP